MYLLSFAHQVLPPRYTNSRLWCSVAWPTTSSLAYKKTTETTATSLIAKMCSSKPINQRWSPRKSPHLSHPSPCSLPALSLLSLPALSLLSSSKCKLIICVVDICFQKAKLMTIRRCTWQIPTTKALSASLRFVIYLFFILFHSYLSTSLVAYRIYMYFANLMTYHLPLY